MNCKICGSSTFCSTFGITYCTECNSQIEETQTETAAEIASSRDLLSSPSVKKTAEDRAQEYSNWITAECYNHIIFKQVTSLINLGASPKLKKTVLYIWSKYLEKCEVVFRTDYQAEDGTPHLGPAPSRRDINILYGDKKISGRKRRNSEVSSVSGATSGEESIILSDSDIASDTNSTASSVYVSVKKKYSSHTRKLYRKSSLNAANKAKYRRKVFSMTLPKTLSFCYLGLLYAEDQLALTDFIRFICEEKIPYINIIDKLPESMKLQEVVDYNMFLSYTVPDAYSILKTSLQIAKFLKLPKFKEPSIFLAVSRFVKDLNLPDDIKSVVKVLVEKYKEKSSILEEVPLDYQALAFIIVALKLLFILDGDFEDEHSRTMNKLNAIHPDKNYFVWREWKEQMSLKDYLFLCEDLGYSAINKLNSLSADTIISKCHFSHLKSPTTDVHKPRDFLALRKEIKDILSSVVTIPDKNEVAPTSFPLTNETNCFMREWRTLPMYKETKEIDFTLLQKDFTPCSLHFNPLQFDKDDDELSYLLMTSLYLHETVLEKKCSHFNSNIHQVIETTSKYWFFNYVRSGKSDFSSNCLDNLPSSFKWLINFISKYTYCKNIDLYKEVSRIEKVLFLNLKKRNRRHALMEQSVLSNITFQSGRRLIVFQNTNSFINSSTSCSALQGFPGTTV